jgi:hypothetical protein
MHSPNRTATGEMPIMLHQIAARGGIKVVGGETCRDRKICQSKYREGIDTKHFSQFPASGLARHSLRGGGHLLL